MITMIKTIFLIFLVLYTHTNCSIYEMNSFNDNQNMLFQSTEACKKLMEITRQVLEYMVSNKIITSMNEEEWQSFVTAIIADLIHNENIKKNVLPLCSELMQYEKAVSLCEEREYSLQNISKHNSFISALLINCYCWSMFFGCSPVTQTCDRHRSFFNFNSCTCETTCDKTIKLNFYSKILLALFSTTHIITFLIHNSYEILFGHKKKIQKFEKTRLEEIHNIVYGYIYNTIIELIENQQKESQE